MCGRETERETERDREGEVCERQREREWERGVCERDRERDRETEREGEVCVRETERERERERQTDRHEICDLPGLNAAEQGICVVSDEVEQNKKRLGSDDRRWTFQQPHYLLQEILKETGRNGLYDERRWECFI